MNFNEALEAMVKHAKDNPSHGIDCACKDEFIRAAKQSLEIPNLHDHLQDKTKANKRYNLNYLCQSIIRSLKY